jgi:hypothetical protein
MLKIRWNGITGRYEKADNTFREESKALLERRHVV